jgi:hypothetical protein
MPSSLTHSEDAVSSPLRVGDLEGIAPAPGVDPVLVRAGNGLEPYLVNWHTPSRRSAEIAARRKVIDVIGPPDCQAKHLQQGQGLRQYFPAGGHSLHSPSRPASGTSCARSCSAGPGRWGS